MKNMIKKHAKIATISPFMNSLHGRDSKFCKRQITQRTSKLNAKLCRLKTNGITYLDLMR